MRSYLNYFLPAFIVLVAGNAFAQTESGAIRGNVVDRTNAIVRNAEVEARNLATGITVKTTTNRKGDYVILALPPGRYDVTASATGFAKETQQDVEVNVDAKVRINFDLKLGNVSEVVRVTAETPLLESDTSSSGQVLNNHLVTTLPLNGRNYSSLALLAPGSMPNYGSRAVDAVSVNGQRTFQNVYLLDGIDNNNYILGVDTNSVQAIRPSIDAIQEFKLESSNYSAEFGHAAGGIVNVTLKSGGNDFHGSAFEFLRNNALDANDFFNNRAGKDRPPLKRNEFGATLGGRIIPNKTFFFLSYQSTRVNSGIARSTVVPAGNQALGDFSNLGVPIIDPLTKQPFPGNIIPPDRLDPVGKKLAALYPAPNVVGQSNNFASSPVTKDNENQGDGRVDHQFSAKDSLFGRISRSSRDINQQGYFAAPGNGGTSIFDAPLFQTPAGLSAVFNETHIFSQSLVNEFRAGYTRNSDQTDTTATSNSYADFGIKGVPQFAGLKGLPFITVSGYSNLGDRNFAPNPKLTQVRQFLDNVSWIRGSHTIKMGGDVRFNSLFAGTSNNARGSFTFNGQFTGNSLADLLLGDTSTAGLTSFQQGNYRNRYFGVFVNDTWKVNQSLTLNMGVRYEIQTPNFEKYNNQGILDIDPSSSSYLKIVPASGDSIRSRTFSDLELHNVAPRLGFAYQLNPKTVIRSSGGIFYGQWGYQAIAQMGAANAPYFLGVTLATARTASTSSLVLSNGFPAGLLTPARLVNPNAFVLLPHFPLPEVFEWMFGVERELPFGMVASVNYIGSSTAHLPGFVDINDPPPGPGANIAARRPYPGYGTIIVNSGFVHATYESLQAKVEKRFGGGLALLTSYTYSHNIDNSVNGEDTFGATTPQDPRNLRAEKASSAIDLRQRLITSTSYELPFGKNGGWTGNLFGNWQIGGIFTAQTGNPFTPVVSKNPANTAGAANTQRPDRLANGNLPSGQRTIDNWFDLSAFAPAAQFTFGNSGRNVLWGPGLVNFDGMISRFFHIKESMSLEVRAEFFNLTNTAHFARPGAVIDQPASRPGAITSTISPNRQIQLGARFLF